MVRSNDCMSPLRESSSVVLVKAPLTLLLAVAAASAGCLHGSTEEGHPPVHLAQGKAHPHWAYEGEAGPTTWGHLSREYQSCSAGQHQSPVDIQVGRVESARLPALSVHYGPTPATEVNNGHTIQDSVARGDFVELGTDRFELEQFHFHHPSEHTLDGAHFPLEIHFVHRRPSGARLVIAVFVAEGPDHPALHALFDHLPGDHETIRLTADPSTLLPAERRFVEYEGSLTTPPCSEGVTWVVMTTPIFASAGQLRTFAAAFPHNNRPLMPLNGRHLLSSPAP